MTREVAGLDAAREQQLVDEVERKAVAMVAARAPRLAAERPE